MEKRLYEILGIRQYKKFALFCKKLFNRFSNTNNNDNYFLKGYSRENLNFLKTQMIKNMKIHAIGVLIGVIVIVSVLTNEEISLLQLLLGILVAVFNLYSVMLQRYNLLRISKII